MSPNRAATYRHSEIEHHYGPRVHLLADPYLQSQLALLCQEETKQPLINHWISSIYTSLLGIVINQHFPRKETRVRTRMASLHPQEGEFSASLIDPQTPVVVANLARAGTLPSHVCYTALNYLLNPSGVRQDHIGISRATDAHDRVSGSVVSGHKIGGSVEGAWVLIPDPMGATGGTVIETIRLYEKNYGRPKKVIAIHCIITPEYLRRVLPACPELEVVALRLDRGLSPQEVLETIPGQEWDRERGLNDKQYIVPGGGGFGELLNNSYV
jgi:uracil phosphoribosyltransferase